MSEQSEYNPEKTQILDPADLKENQGGGDMSDGVDAAAANPDGAADDGRNIEDEIKVGETRDLVGEEKWREKSEHSGMMKEINKSQRAEKREARRQARKEWWERRKADAARAREAISSGVDSMKAKAAEARQAGGNAKDRVVDWVQDIPANAYGLMADADRVIDNASTGLAKRVEARVDAKEAKLGGKGTELRADADAAKAAVESIQQEGADAFSESNKAKIIDAMWRMVKAERTHKKAEEEAQKAEKKAEDYRKKETIAKKLSAKLRGLRGF